MVPICNICLRSKLNLQSIPNDDLVEFYDELCDYYGSGPKSKFCSECLHRLNKCYEFKKYCRLATKALKSWAKQNKDIRMPKHLLYKSMPGPLLGLCNKNNFKIYAYNRLDLDMKTPILTTLSNSEHIVTFSIPHNENFDERKAEDEDIMNFFDTGSPKPITVDEQKKLECDVKIEFEDVPHCGYDDDENMSLEMDVFKIESKSDGKLATGTDDEFSDGGNSPNSPQQSDDDKSYDSDKSLEEMEKLLVTLKNQQPKKTSGRDDSQKTKREKKTIDVEDLKTKLEQKFDRYGPVKTEEGNTIDAEVVLNNLDKLKFLQPIQKICSESGPFTSLAIRRLAKIHNYYSNTDSTPYTKIFLGTHEEMKAEFESRRQYPTYPHHCKICLKGFTASWLLDYHYKTSHDPDLPFECSICHIRSVSKKGLTNHMSSTHRKVLKCKLCEFSSGSRGTMLNHVDRHNGVKYKCEYCGNAFKAKSILAAHIKKFHDPRHACALCADAFMTEKGLSVHKLKKHRGEEFVPSEANKKCEECDILFASDYVYSKHMKITHLIRDERPRGRKTFVLSCRVCEWKGSSRHRLKEHYKCDHPDTDPTQFHNEYNFLCHDCGKRFHSITQYKGHMNKHSGIRPYACTKCPKTFFSKIHLCVHRKRHLPPTKECSHCGKMFTTPAALSSHMKIHKNDRCFKCNICGKGFLYSSALRVHVNGVHNSIRRKRRKHDAEDDTD